MVPGEAAARSRAEVITLITFAVLAVAGLAAAGLFDFSPRITGASVGLGVCVAAYGVLGGQITKMSNGRKTVAGLLALAVIAGAAWGWPARSVAPPTGLVPQASTNSVTLTWDASAEHGRVKAYRVSRDGAELWQGLATSYVDNAVEPGKHYEYSVIAIGSDGGQSAVISRKVRTPTPSATLRPPTGLAATAVAARAVSLAWTPAPPAAPGGAGHDKLAYSVLRDGAKIAETDRATFTDATVSPTMSYSYALRTVDTSEGEESESSPPVAVTTPALTEEKQPAPQTQQQGPKPPSAPAGFKLEHSNQSSISMSWRQSAPGTSAVAGYRVYRDGGQHRMVGNLSFTDTDLPANKSYEYFVRAFDADGRESADSAHVRMSTLPWARTQVWRFTLYDRTTPGNQADSLKDAIKFNGTSMPSRTQVGVEDYAVAYDKVWTQLFYYGASTGGGPEPAPRDCASQGFTGVDAVPIGAGKLYCRDEDDSAAVGPISFVRCVDISHATETPGYITIEVWFEYLTP